jgi:ATP-binding cassette, subfamily F, member 3
MSYVIISDIAKNFGGEQIFSGVSFRIEPGRSGASGDRIGLVGPNGAGKTTLLNIIAGRLTPDAGEVALARDTRIGYLTQMPEFHPTHTLREEMRAVFEELHAVEADMSEVAAALADPEALNDPDSYQALLDRYAHLQERFEHAEGYTVEQRVQQVLDGLGFTREQQDLPATSLSGGQQTRAALGKLLLQAPDILLLDEPTNHLDLAALEWLEDYLLNWKGAIVTVAHDRYFLDRIAQRIIEVDQQRIEEYPGNYTAYIRLREERMEQRRKAYESQQEHIARTEEFIRRYKAGQRAREARGRQKLLDRLERVERPYHAPELHFKMRVGYESGAIVLETKDLAVGYPGPESQPLIRVPDLQIERGDRIGLIGPNGSGKTTLLRTIVSELPPLAGIITGGYNVKIGYYAQTHEGLEPAARVIDEIRNVSILSEEGARTFLGRFQFRGDDVFKPVGVLSGGERARVALAKLTLMGANFLVLDEPTNHLDLPARQFLEAVLADYDGTLIFVSHDRYFIDAVANRVWIVENGTLRDVEGNYTSYRKRIMAQAAQAQVAAKASQRAAQARSRQQPQPAERTLAQIEAEVAAAEAQLADIEAQLNAAGEVADVTRITQLAEDYAAAKVALDALYDEWEAVAS